MLPGETAILDEARKIFADEDIKHPETAKIDLEQPIDETRIVNRMTSVDQLEDFMKKDDERLLIFSDINGKKITRIVHVVYKCIENPDTGIPPDIKIIMSNDNDDLFHINSKLIISRLLEQMISLGSVRSLADDEFHYLVEEIDGITHHDLHGHNFRVLKRRLDDYKSAE
jgi:hypothetical protein